MKKKIRVGILFGGKSVEHKVSLLSAKNVIAALDPEKYIPVLLPIDMSGRWHLASVKTIEKLDSAFTHTSDIALSPASAGRLETSKNEEKLDVIFPVLHGTNGEDGTIQGLLKLADIPFVGSSVMASAIGMDKDVTKRLLREANIPIGKFLAFQKNEKLNYREISRSLGRTVFVKPAHLGSSIGVSKVKNEKEFQRAIKLAFSYDTKVLIESFISCREIECAVLGNESPQASVVGEIIPHHEFYTYEAKYLDENGADFKIPAALTRKQTRGIQKLALDAFKALGCEGMARVDFFMNKKNGKVFVNELNTIPGFTAISMYPKLWEASGLSYRELIDKLILLALDRYKKESLLKTVRS